MKLNRVASGLAFCVLFAVAIIGCDPFAGENNTYVFVLTVNGDGRVSRSPFQNDYPQGDEVTLTAIPDEGWEFYRWEGDVEGTENPITVTMESDIDIVAVFGMMHTLEVSADGEGTVTCDPDNEMYSSLVPVKLTAVPATDWFFDHWEGDASGQQNPYLISVDEDRSVIAVFQEIDKTKPVITLLGNPNVQIQAGSVYSDAGALADDDADGNISYLITVHNPVDTATPGTYIITYNVSDSTGNAADEVSREVIVDGVAPTLTLNGDASVTFAVGDTWYDPGAAATDDFEGDISYRVGGTPSSWDYRNVPGTYTIEYTVSDWVGNAATPIAREVIVYDDTPPVISLEGQARVITLAGEAYLDAGATASDDVDGDITTEVVVDNPVDNSVSATYTVRYNVSDAAGNAATEVTRLVDVILLDASIDRLSQGEDDIAYQMIAATDGGYVIAGATSSGSGGVWGSDKIWILKIDDTGSLVWDTVFEDSTAGFGESVCSTSDGGYVVAGKSLFYDHVSMKTQAWILKVDASGNEVWRAQLPGYGFAKAFSVIENSTGELLVTGQTSSESLSDQVWVAKLDSSGNVVWEADYGGGGTEQGNEIIECATGGYLVAGTTTSFGAGSIDTWLLRIDDDGGQMWAETFGGAGDDRVSAVIETSGDVFAFAGSTTSGSAGGRDVWCVTVDQSGSLLAENTYGTTSEEWATDLIEPSSGGLAMIGTRGTGWSSGFLVVEADQTGAATGERYFSYMNNNGGSSIVQRPDGSLLIVGSYTVTSVTYGTHWNMWLLAL